MMENSCVSNNQASVIDPTCLSEKEVMLLAMFRVISAQRQNDVIRILEAFTHIPGL